jgi:hypothetical protein
MHQQQQSAAAPFNLNAFAASAQAAMPPGYAYFYQPTGMHHNMAGFGANTGMYPGIPNVPTGSATATTQFQQKSGYNST